MGVCMSGMIGMRDGVGELNHPHYRVDPYFEGLWEGSSHYYWSSFNQIAARTPRARTWHGRLIPGEKTAWTVIRDPQNLIHALTVIAVVSAYRTMTEQQCAGFVSVPQTVLFDEIVMALFRVGLIDLGWFVGAGEAEVGWPVGLKIGDTRAPWWELRRSLTNEQRWATTPGGKLVRGLQPERHNIVTSEVMLRAAQFLPGVVVGGEAQSVMFRITGTERTGPSRGDGVIVFPHGDMCVIETSGSFFGLEVGKKVRHWVDALYRSRVCRPYIIFVNTVSPQRVPDSMSHIRASIQKVLATSYSGPYYRDVWRHVCLVHYEDWFTREKQPTERFMNLTVSRYDGDTGCWYDAPLVDEFAVVGEPAPLYRGLCSTFITPSWTRIAPYQLWTLRMPEPWWDGYHKAGSRLNELYAPWRWG